MSTITHDQAEAIEADALGLLIATAMGDAAAVGTIMSAYQTGDPEHDRERLSVLTGGLAAMALGCMAGMTGDPGDAAEPKPLTAGHLREHGERLGISDRTGGLAG